MKKKELQIMGISSGHTTTSYTLILEEKGGKRKLPVIIGAFEAQAIAIEIEKIVPVRPMTHDLFKSFATTCGAEITEVIIHKLHEGIFYASVIVQRDGEQHEIDARTSDAIAIGLRFNCPIYTYEEILQEAGIVLSDLETETIEQEEREKAGKTGGKDEPLSEKTLEELNTMLEEAIEVENYIKAAKIRDEIKSREQGEGGKKSSRG